MYDRHEEIAKKILTFLKLFKLFYNFNSFKYFLYNFKYIYICILSVKTFHGGTLKDLLYLHCIPFIYLITYIMAIHNIFNHSPINGHSYYFHSFTIANNAANSMLILYIFHYIIFPWKFLLE